MDRDYEWQPASKFHEGFQGTLPLGSIGFSSVGAYIKKLIAKTLEVVFYQTGIFIAIGNDMSDSQKTTHLSETLKRLMRERDMNAADINRMKPSLLNSFLSRIIRGDQAFIDQQDLHKLADCFKRHKGEATPLDAAAIIAAHCADECKGPGSELVIITVGESKLSPKAERSLEYIRRTVKTDARTESLIENLAHLLGMKTC